MSWVVIPSLHHPKFTHLLKLFYPYSREGTTALYISLAPCGFPPISEEGPLWFIAKICGSCPWDLNAVSRRKDTHSQHRELQPFNWGCLSVFCAP
jgi:hypothetical protein